MRVYSSHFVGRRCTQNLIGMGILSDTVHQNPPTAFMHMFSQVNRLICVVC